MTVELRRLRISPSMTSIGIAKDTTILSYLSRQYIKNEVSGYTDWNFLKIHCVSKLGSVLEVMLF